MTTNGVSISRWSKFPKRPSTSFSPLKTRISTNTMVLIFKPLFVQHGKISQAAASFPALRPFPCNSFPSHVRESAPLRPDASVNEPGGRAVTGHATVISLPSEQFLGLRKNQTTAENKVEIAYEVLSYEKDKPVTPLSAPVTFKLYKCDWDYTMKKTGYGQLRYEWTKTSLPVGEPKTIDLTETKGVIPFDIRYHGSYELVATCGDNIQTRLEFYYW